MKKGILSVILACILCFLGMGCSGADNDKSSNAIKLSFKSASGYDYLKTIDGEIVSINGYIATSSPVDGSFIFLMNLPYQSCPFCVPNTSQLSNTMEVYPKKGEKFAYTSQAIKITGKLVVAENIDEPFTDKYGYEFNYKIVDASYKILQASDMSADLALWQKIASTDVITEVYRMYDYVNFCCNWNTYFVNSYKDENGDIQKGYYLYASDAEYYLFTENAQWNYGYKDGYFQGIIDRINAVDKNAFLDLIENIEKAEVLANKAIQDLINEEYTSEYVYVEKFEQYDYIFSLNNGEELSNEMDALYLEFSNWLGSWEM